MLDTLKSAVLKGRADAIDEMHLRECFDIVLGFIPMSTRRDVAYKIHSVKLATITTRQVRTPIPRCPGKN